MTSSWMTSRALTRTIVVLIVFEVLIGLFNLGYLQSDRRSNQGWLDRQETGAIPSQPQSPPNPEQLALGLELKRLIKYQFDLDREGNFVTWYSSALSLVAGLTAIGLFRVRGRRGWLVLAIGFLALSMDEVAQLHEWIGTYLSKSGFSARSLMAPYPWALSLGPLMIALGVWMLVFLKRAMKDMPRLRNLAWVALVLMMAVIPLELIGALIQGQLPHPPRLMVIFEETFEMIGLTLMVFVLVSLVRRGRGTQRVPEPTQG